MIAVCGFCLICTVILVLLRKGNPEFAVPVSLLAGAAVLLFIIGSSVGIFNMISEFSQNAGMDEAHIKLIFKALGICYITRLACDVCKDSGETALASKVDLAGRITIAALSLPLITALLQTVTTLLM